MYTTLLDENGNVISTNDPTENKSEHSKEVKAGDAVSVKFRMEDIIPNDGEDGVQEDRVYYMTLPEELIPAAKNSNGEQLVNPTEPLKFFGDDDGIQAYGGIYNVGGEYQLRMIFENVADWIEVSGYFQYGANVSNTVIPGETYELSYVPGGTVFFTVAKDSPIVHYGNYALSLNGDTGGPTTYYWQVSVNKLDDGLKVASESEAEIDDVENPDEKTDPAIFPFKELTIDSDDAMGVWINEAEEGIFNAYGDNSGSGLKLEITYETKNQEGSYESEILTADSDSIIENTDGKTVIRFAANELQADVEFTKEDAVANTLMRNSHKQFSYLTNKIHVHLSDGFGGNAKNIKGLKFWIPTLAYDDYCRTGEVTYHGRAVLSTSVSAEEASNKNETVNASDRKEITATGRIQVNYGDLTSPLINGQPGDPSNSYEFLPEEIYTHLGSGETRYKGNYYWMEFNPAIKDTSGANYYLSNQSFLPGNPFWHSYNTTFGDGGLYGMTGANDFQYLQKISVKKIKEDDNVVAHSFMKNNDEEPQLDAKLQYQLKQVFAQAQDDHDMIIYRSQTPHLYGEYSYLVIDPQTVQTAQQNKKMEWRAYVEGANQNSLGRLSAQAASFKIHIFNAPCTTLQLDMRQKIGSVIADDKNYTDAYSDGTYYAKPKLTDEIKTGIKTEDGEDEVRHTATTTLTFNKYQASYMEGVWADEDTIFWKMTFDTSNWPVSQQGSIYVNAGLNMQMMTDQKKILMEGQKFDTHKMYINNGSSEAWEPIDITNWDSFSWNTPATSEEMTEDTTLSSNNNEHTYHFRYNKTNWIEHQSSGNGSFQDVTVGFFTHVEHIPKTYEPQLSCTAEIVVQNGDVSKLYGYDQNQFPNSGQGDMIQFPFKISATGIAPSPSLYKTGYPIIEKNGSSKMNASWQIQITNIQAAQAINPNKNLPLWNQYPTYYLKDGYSGILSITDDMRESIATDIHGNAVETVNPGQYTYIKRMLWNDLTSASISVNESRNGGNCGPVPYETTDKNGLPYAMGDGNWQKYENGNWISMNVGHTWDPYHPGIYRRVLQNSGNHEKEPLEVYIYYAGNMCESVQKSLRKQLSDLGRENSESYVHSLVVEYRGLKWVNSISPLVYTTEFDQEAFRKAADEAAGKITEEQQIASYYDVTLQNSAGVGSWANKGKNPVTASINKKISAQLLIEKKAEPVKQDETGGFSGEYTIRVVNGISSSDYVGVEDFLTKFSNVKQDKTAAGKIETVTGKTYNLETDNPTQENMNVVNALIRHTRISNLVITAQTAENAPKTTVYENGHFTDDWNSSELKFSTDVGYSSEKKGSLFQITFKKNSGQIPAETEFLIDYTMTLDMDTTDTKLDGKTFRQSDYYEGNGLQIFNNAEASRTYTIPQTQKNRRVKATDPNGTIIDLGNGKQLLKVDCGGSVENTYLIKTLLEKTYENNGTDPTVSDWFSSTYTGTMGRGNDADDITIHDSLTYESSQLSVKDPKNGQLVPYTKLNDSMKTNVAALLEHLVEKYSIYQNIKLYYTDVKPKNKSELREEDIIWEVPQAPAGGTEITNGRLYYSDSDGVSHNTYEDLKMELTLGETPASTTQHWAGDPEKYPDVKLQVTTRPTSLRIKSTEPLEVSHEHAGFTVKAEGLERQKYLVATYQIKTDWNQVYMKAIRIFGGVSYRGYLKNLIDDELSASASSKGNSVSITDSSLTKDIISASPETGEGQWRIIASTGSQTGDELIIKDRFKIQFPEDSVLSEEEKHQIQTAAEAATSIDPTSVKITENNAILYQHQTPAAGWDNNLEITLSDQNKALKVVIKNQSDDKVLKQNQTYRVIYNTQFDLNAFVQNGGFTQKKNGTDTIPAKYSLANTVTMNYGVLQKNETQEQTFNPTIPLGADKAPRTPDGKTSDGNIQPWTVTADTKEAARTEFTISDQATVMDVEESKNDAFNHALYLSSWSAKVLTYDDEKGEHVIDEKEYTKDTLPSDITLTDQAGKPLEIGKVGTSGFILTFKTLPAKHKVEVIYVTALDRETFLAAGGADGSVVSLQNHLLVSAADGNEKGTAVQGHITINPPLEKKGDAETAGKTVDGNPILTWSADVDLTDLYTIEELKNIKTITLTDKLHPALKLISGSVKLKNTSGEAITPIPTWQMKGNQLTVDVVDPVAHPNFTLTFQTECQASLDALTNTMELTVDGTKTTTAQSNELKDLVALSQYGQIVAMKRPEVTIEAKKYVDHQICTDADRYRFELTAVDANGTPLTGKDAYSEIVSNDAEGRVRFSKIRYNRIRADQATYYYQIRELPDTIDNMILDNRVFTVKVEIQKNGKYYFTVTTVVSPENYSEVAFDNTTKPKLTEFTVKKVWEDNNNAAGLRPDSIVAHLYQNQQPYNNMMVTLNESNNWTYTWTDLPEAGGGYSVVEDSVKNYEGNAVTTNTETILTNKLIEQPEEPNKPDQPDTPEKPEKPDEPDSPNKPNEPDKPSKPGNQDTQDHPAQSGGTGGSNHDQNADHPNPDSPDSITPTHSDKNANDSNHTDESEAFPLPNGSNHPTNDKKHSLPKTGDVWWPALIFMAFSAAMLIGKIGRKRKDWRKQHKS